MIRKTTDQRIRGRKLQLLRRHLFQMQPLCVVCEEQGRVRLATERDHIVALCNGGTDTEENTQALCAQCHDAKTLRDTGKQKKQIIGLDGWPIDDTGEGRHRGGQVRSQKTPSGNRRGGFRT